MTQATRYEVQVAEALTQTLLREGITRVFGVPGGYFTVLFDAFRRAELPSIEGRHEGAAACMAAGYAQASGQVGVVYTQCGPGTTNAVTGIAAGYMDSIPMLLLCSQTGRDDYGRDGHQESTGATLGPDQVELFRSFSHCLAKPPTPASAVRMARYALNSAVGHKGPAVLELHADLLGQMVGFDDLPRQAYRATSQPVDDRQVHEAAALLAQARRPAILVGNRLAHTGAGADLLAFCEEHEVACATVDYAKGTLPEDHPLALGILGQSGHQSAGEYFREADLVLLLGVRMSSATTIRYDAELFKNVIQVDADPKEIGRSLPVRLGIVGDVAGTLKALRAAARPGPTPARGTAARVAELRRKHKVYAPPTNLDEEAKLVPADLFRVLRQELPREVSVVSDTGWTAVGFKQYFPVYRPDSFYALYALAPMGSGLPLSLGVQVARPDETVVDVIGDGGFLVHAGELNVAVQHKLPVIHVVVKNGLYKSVADRQMHWYGSYYATEIPNPNYAQVARSFGCDGYSPKNAHELRVALRAALAARRPAVIEVDVAPDFALDAMPEALRKAHDDLFPKARQGWPMPRP